MSATLRLSCRTSNQSQMAYGILPVVSIGSMMIAGFALMLSLHAAHAQEGPAESLRLVIPGNVQQDPWQVLTLIDRAALEVCGDDPRSLYPMRNAVANSDCRKQALEHAVAQMHAPAVRNMLPRYEQRSGIS